MSSYVLFERFSKGDENRGKGEKGEKTGKEREEEKGRDAYIHSPNKYASNVSHEELTGGGEGIPTSGVRVLALDGRDSTRLDEYAKMESIRQPNKARALHIRAVELTNAGGHQPKTKDHEQKESRDNSKSGGDENADALHIRAVELTNASGHQPKTKDHQQKESRDNSKSGGNDKAHALHFGAVELTNTNGHQPKTKDHQQKEVRDNSKSGGNDKADALHIRAVELTNASGHQPKTKDHQQKEARDNSKSGGDENADVYIDRPPIYCKQVHGADIWLIDKGGGSRVFPANDYRNPSKNESINLEEKFSKDAFNRLDLYGKKSDTNDKKNNAAKRDFLTTHGNTSGENTSDGNTSDGNTGGGNTGSENTSGGNTGGENTGNGNTSGGMIAKQKKWQQKASLTVGGGEHMPLGYRQNSTQHADNSTQSQENTNRSESGKENLQSSWVVADGMVTNMRHCALAIRTADCLPIMMWQLDACKGASPVIAALHGGWRSLDGGIIQNAFSVIERTYQLSGASFAALVAPAISDRAYEVDERFIQTVSNGMGGMMHVDQFAKPIKNKQSKWWFDLKDWANSILLSCGVLQRNIQLLNVCTYHDGEYFSYRRNQQAGRNISIIQSF